MDIEEKIKEIRKAKALGKLKVPAGVSVDSVEQKIISDLVNEKAGLKSASPMPMNLLKSEPAAPKTVSEKASAEQPELARDLASLAARAKPKEIKVAEKAAIKVASAPNPEKAHADELSKLYDKLKNRNQLTNGDALTAGLMALIPTLVGGLVGGNEGAAAGAEAGKGGIQFMLGEKSLNDQREQEGLAKELDHKNAIEIQKLKGEQDLNKLRLEASLSQSSPKNSVGQNEVDKKFANDYQQYFAQGGIKAVEKNLSVLEEAAKELKANPSLSGGWTEMGPDILRKKIKPESAALQQKVQETAVLSLKQALGSQFTERDREIIMNMSYDPNLPAKDNLKKIRQASEYIRSRAKEMEAAGKYFEQNQGSLAGYAPANNNSVQQQQSAPSSPSMPKKVIQNGIVYTLNEQTGQYE